MRSLRPVSQFPLQISVYRFLNRPDFRQDNVYLRFPERRLGSPPHAPGQQQVTILNVGQHLGVALAGVRPEAVALFVRTVLVPLLVVVAVLSAKGMVAGFIT